MLPHYSSSFPFFPALDIGELFIFYSVEGGAGPSKSSRLFRFPWKLRRGGNFEDLSPREKVERSEVLSYWLRLSFLLSRFGARLGPANELIDELEPRWLSRPPRFELPLLRVNLGLFVN